MRHYYDLVKSLRPANLTAYWSLHGNALDSSGHGFNGTASSVTWGAAGIGDGYTSASFNGTNSYINVYSSGLSSAFGKDAGTVLVWLRAASASQWTNGSNRYIVRFYANSTQQVSLRKPPDTSRVLVYVPGNTALVVVSADAVWHAAVIVWSDATLTGSMYWDGRLVAQIPTTAWPASVPTTMVIGSEGGGLRSWFGDLAHVALWDVALSESEIVDLYRPTWITPITDRTPADIQARSAKAFWNVADWTRVDSNVKSLRHRIFEYDGLMPPMTVLTPPVETLFPQASGINQLIENIENTRVAAIPNAALKHDYIAGLGATAPDFVAVNAWESVQAALYSAVPSAYAYCFACGATVAGQPRAWERG